MGYVRVKLAVPVHALRLQETPFADEEMEVQRGVSRYPSCRPFLGCLWHLLPSLPCSSPVWVTPCGLSGPTHLLHLLLGAVGANAFEGLLGIISVPALLLI